MSEPTRIEEVRERVRDFTKALREAGAKDVAQRIDGYADGFVDSARVRRSVDAIRQQLRYFRTNPEELPDLPLVHITANRLEDACKDALRAELIAPARLSLRAQSKRKLSLLLMTLLLAGGALLVPFAAALAGVDFSDVLRERRLPIVQLQKGTVTHVDVSALVPSADPSGTASVEFSIAGACPPRLPSGASCHSSGRKSFGALELSAYEVMLPDQAYGIQVGFGEARLGGAVGQGSVLVSAGPETPEGVYAVPLTAAYVGYAPGRCNWYLRVLSRCTEKQRGAQLRHENVPVPTMQIQVVPARQSSADLRAEQTRQRRERLAERAAQIAGAVKEIQAVLDDTQAQLRRKRYDVVQERIDKLTRLFEPLDALAVLGAEGELLPVDVVSLRARFEAQRKELVAFHDRAFEQAYAALSSPRKPDQTDDVILSKVARELAISREHMDRIYADHAELLEQRLARVEAEKQRAEQAAQAALLKRCGELPKSAWRNVQSYLAERNRGDVRVRLGECMTPRLSPKTCWSVVCDFEEITSSPDELLDRVTKRKWTFRLKDDRVIAHSTRVDETGNTAAEL